MSELLPCPFCGSHEVARQSAMGEYWVLCETCLATSAMIHYEQGADILWNTRPVSATAVEITMDKCDRCSRLPDDGELCWRSMVSGVTCSLCLEAAIGKVGGTAVEVTEEQVRAMVLADDMQTGHERCRHMLRAALAAGLGNGVKS